MIFNILTTIFILIALFLNINTFKKMEETIKIYKMMLEDKKKEIKELERKNES